MKKRYKPYYSLSGLSGLGALGDLSPDIELLVETNQNNLERIIAQLEQEANRNKAILSFEDNDLLYNQGITTPQKQAWVYYKRRYLGIPMSGGWKKYYLKGDAENPFGTEAEVFGLVRDRALYYSDGKYLPYPVFSWGNMYERENQLLEDKDFIVAQFGEAVYLDHLHIVNTSKPTQIRVDDEDPTKRAVITAVSTTAKTFTIKEVRAEFMNDISQSEQITNTGKRIDTKKRINLAFDGEQSYPIREVFVKWLYTLDPKRYFDPNASAFSVSNYYVYGFPISGPDKDRSSSEQAEIKQLARENGERLFALFLREVLTDADIKRLNDSFNARYNGWANLKYNSIPIGLETSSTFLNQGFAIRPEKREAIAYMEAVGSGILAYDVGVGKTVSALLELANALHQAKCKRPLIIVPNPTYNNWLKEAMGGTDKDTGEQFSGVLSGLGYKVNDWYNLNTKLVSKLDKEGVLDRLVPEGTITFMSYEGFKQLGFSKNVNRNFINELRDILEQEITDPTLDAGKTLNGLNRMMVEDMAEFGKMGEEFQIGESDLGKTARDEAKEEKNYLEIIGLGNKNSICDVDTLGFDYIIIDEAHRCKAVFNAVSADEEGKKNFLLTGNQSTTGIKAFFICNYIQKTFGRNVMLLTATPFTNSPLEVYSMLSLVGYDLLKDSGYYNINDFFTQFAKVDVEYVVRANGDVTTKEVIKGFNNRQILQKLIFTKVNYKTGEDVGVKRPCKINLPMLGRSQSSIQGLGKTSRNGQVLTYLEMNEMQAENQEQIISMINAALTPQGGKIDKGMLFRGLSASLDNALSPYLYKLGQVEPPSNYKEFVENSPKIKYVVDCCASVKAHHEKMGTQVSGQVIYANRGVEYFYLIKEYLHKEVGYKSAVDFEGQKLSEVMIISGGGAKEKVDKEVIKEAFNAGVVKVIIGSSTIREGINLQKRGTVLYDMYPDWNPTDVRQLEGRIWRQGNKFGYVRVVMPLVEGSMDVFVFQKLEEKTARINDLFYREGSANVLDLDSIDPSEIKYALISDVGQLAKIDFAIERSRAKNAVQLMAEDSDAINSLADDLAEMVEARSEAVELVQEAKTKIAKYIDNYSSSEESHYKENVKRAQKYLTEIDDYLANPSDEVLIRFQQKFENWNNRAGYSYSIWGYKIRQFAEYFREVRKKEREVLKPKGYSLESNFSEVASQIKAEFEEKLESFQSQYGQSDTETDWPKTKRYREIYDEIIQKKERLKVKGMPVDRRVAEFESLNYLLNYTADQVDPSSCELPEPGQIPPAKLTCPPLDEKGNKRIDPEGLKMLNECIDKEPISKDRNILPDGSYTKERTVMHQAIIDEVKSQKPCRVNGQPIAILTGGPPGSGKTTFLKKFAPWMNSGNLYRIDADEIRAKLPEYKGWNSFNTHAETRDIVNNLLDQIGQPCESDVIYDGTMNKATNYIPLIAKLRSLGYKIFVIYIQVPKTVSIERAMARYQRSGRYVPIEVINEVFDKGMTAYEEIIKSVDGFIRVDGVTQNIIERGGMELPKDRNYDFRRNVSDKGVDDIEMLELEAEALALELELLSLSGFVAGINGYDLEIKSNKDVGRVFQRLMKDEAERDDYGIHGLLYDWKGVEYDPLDDVLYSEDNRSGTGKLRYSKKEFINWILTKADKDLPEIGEYVESLRAIILDELQSGKSKILVSK